VIGVKLLGNKKLELREFAEPKASNDWVTIRVKACALCGSDLNYRYRPSNENAYNNNRTIPGHEIAGEVVEVDRPEHLKIGDRVLAYPLVGCMDCFFCKNNLWKGCKNVRAIGFDLNGGHAEYLTAPERNLLPIPNDISFDVAALIWDGIGASYGVIKKLRVNAEDVVAVFGSGPIGLGAITACKFLGASVIAVDILQNRLDLAEEIGADYRINPKTQNVEEQIRRLTSGFGPDVCLECTGSEDVLYQVLRTVRLGGRCGLIGEQAEARQVNFTEEILHRDLSLTGGWMYGHDEVDELIELVRRGLRVDKIVTHKFPLDESEKAWALFDSGKTGKVIIVP